MSVRADMRKYRSKEDISEEEESWEGEARVAQVLVSTQMRVLEVF